MVYRVSLAFLTSVETDREHAYVIILLYGF